MEQQKRHRTSHAEIIRLSQWVSENKDSLQTMSLNELAFEAQKSLGFTISRGLITECATALGLQAGIGREKSSEKRGDAARILARSISNILAQLGLPADEAVNKIASR